MANAGPRIDRRDMLRIVGAAAVSLALPHGSAFAQTRKDTLVLGLDISYTLNLDPARALNFTGPETVSAAYETLLTFSPGDYINLKPLLATEWKRTPDGKGWRLTLREGVKFASGNVMTADDVKFSIDRVVNLKDQPSQYLTQPRARSTSSTCQDRRSHPQGSGGADPDDLDAAPDFSILDRKTVEALGGTSAADAKDKDKASAWLESGIPPAPDPSSRPSGSATRRSSSSPIRTIGAAGRRSSGSSSATWTKAARNCWRCATATSTRRST